MKKLLVAVLWLTVAGCSAGAASRPQAGAGPPRCFGTDEAQPLDPAAGKIDELMARYVPFGFSGSVLIIRDGKTLLHRGYGRASDEKAQAATSQTLYDVASVAKTFTAAAILDLEGRGMISTFHTLAQHFQGLPPDKAAITLHELLTHTSGFPLDASDAGIAFGDSNALILSKIRSFPLRGKKGTYDYSNLGYGLLAIIIEKVSGETWQSYVKRRLVDRAGLRNTFLQGQPAPRGLVTARGYLGSVDEGLQLQPVPRPSAAGGWLWGKHPIGSVGINMSVGDLASWWCALNGTHLLPEPQRRRLFEIQAANQGYGWNIQETPHGKRIYRGGLRGGFQSLVAYYPASNTLVVFALNRNASNQWPGLVWSNIERLLRDETVAMPPAVLETPATALPAGEVAYVLPTGGRLRFDARDGGRLYFGVEGQDAIDLIEGASPEPATRDRAVAATRDVLRALAERNRSRLAGLTRMQAGDLEALIDKSGRWAADGATLEPADLLGATRGSGKAVRVFFRLSGSRAAAPVVRFLWNMEEGRLLAWGDDIPLPLHRRVWRTATEGEFASFDFSNNRTLFYRLGAEGAALVSPDGETIARGVRQTPGGGG